MTDRDERVLRLARAEALRRHWAAEHIPAWEECHGQDCLAVREAEANLLAEPTEQPYDAKGRWMLNSYGRQCYERGYESGKRAAIREAEAEAQQPEPTDDQILDAIQRDRMLSDLYFDREYERAHLTIWTHQMYAPLVRPAVKTPPTPKEQPK